MTNKILNNNFKFCRSLTIMIKGSKEDITFANSTSILKCCGIIIYDHKVCGIRYNNRGAGLHFRYQFRELHKVIHYD